MKEELSSNTVIFCYWTTVCLMSIHPESSFESIECFRDTVDCRITLDYFQEHICSLY